MYVIAEIGVNHDGNLDKAKQLVDAAAQVGANAVKFQLFDSGRIATQDARPARYQNAQDISQQELLRSLELSVAEHRELSHRAHVMGIDFMTTAFEPDFMSRLEELDCPAIKIGSGDLTFTTLLRAAARTRLPILLSTGMATMDEIHEALQVLVKFGRKLEEITLMHCVSCYPTPAEQANLRRMGRLQETFGVSVGLSDHTIGIEAGIMAVAMGAKVIEKHITLDRLAPGPDHKASLDIDGFKVFVQGIRTASLLLGSGDLGPQECESDARVASRRSLVAARPILAGEKFTGDNVECRRPGTGLSPTLMDMLIGTSAKRSFARHEILEL